MVTERADACAFLDTRYHTRAHVSVCQRAYECACTSSQVPFRILHPQPLTFNSKP
jgi:hypothetical protein